MQVTGSVFLREGFEATGTVRLHGATIGGTLDCTGGTFTNPNMEGFGLRLDQMTAGSLVWANVTVHSTTSISFRHAAVGVLADDQNSWPAQGHLLLDGFTYTRLHETAPQDPPTRLKWIRRNPNYQPQPYEQLIRVYRAAAQDREARHIAIAKQKARRTSGKLQPWQKPFHWLFGGVGYGHKPYRAIWALLAVILIGSAIYTTAQHADALAPTRNDTATANQCTSAYPCLQPLIYSIDVTLPIINFEQRTYWLPDTSTNHGTWVQYWMWASILVGWALSTLFVAAITGLIKRD